MDGKWDGVSPHFNGWDDGIILTNETGDLISGNTIQHVWDAGIEGAYSLTNTVISNNTIQHTLTAAMGAWWYTEWIGNQILNNQADDVSQLLSIYYDENVGIPPPSKVHFESNRFVGNVILHPSAFDTFALNSQSKITIKPAGYPQVLADNNVLQDNHFGQFAPELIPAAGFIDGGGNVCQTATAVIACNR